MLLDAIFGRERPFLSTLQVQHETDLADRQCSKRANALNGISGYEWCRWVLDAGFQVIHLAGYGVTAPAIGVNLALQIQH